MATKLVAMLCEGPHDVAFLTQILKTAGFSYNESLKIGEYPHPINGLFLTELQKTNMEGLNFQEVRQALLPMNTMQKDENFVFLYALGGDKKSAARQKMVIDFLSLVPAPGEIRKLPRDIEFSIIYFFDADQKGVSNRLAEINAELEGIVGSKPFSLNAEKVTVNGVVFGCYIFSMDGNVGNLEDILIPLLEKENEVIFQAAREYLEKHYDEKRCKKNDYDEKKSTIGIAGQLQKSGSTNTVIISKSDYINAAKISSDDNCKKIVEFILAI